MRNLVKISGTDIERSRGVSGRPARSLEPGTEAMLPWTMTHEFHFHKVGGQNLVGLVFWAQPVVDGDRTEQYDLLAL